METIDFEQGPISERLETQGIDIAETKRQWSLLNGASEPVLLDRACTIGDGIEQVRESDHVGLIAEHQAAVDKGRWSKFIPASGAASRMFALQTDDTRQRFCESIHQFAFAGKLRNLLSDQGKDLHQLLNANNCGAIVDAVLSTDGLGYADSPKGLIPFHEYNHETRTPFEEHLIESLACLSQGEGSIRAHFTVSPQHEWRFIECLKQFKASHLNQQCDVNFSTQHPATDTIGMNSQGGLFVEPDGTPVLRPGGHGALLLNLNDLQADQIFIKNIDNVAHERHRSATITWTQILCGYLTRLQNIVHQRLRDLLSGGDQALADAHDFVLQTFPGVSLPADDDREALRTALQSRLNRPLRVCGMVKNEGEPGGGPFWVRQSDGGIVPQIVEAAELDGNDADQRAVVQQTTHFNPVFMALAVRDHQGRPFDLSQFVNNNRVIITQKPVGDEMAKVLERPGLWNGAMAHWNSIFIEVPKEIFSPVKTVFDLLRDEHQSVRAEQSGG